MSAHDRYLQRALVLAKQNIADGGRPFGAVLVRNDEIVAESVNTFHLSGDPTAHAELNAVRDLAARLGSAVLRECVIYASGQPCPMCLSALYLTGVREVFSPIAIRTGSLFSSRPPRFISSCSSRWPSKRCRSIIARSRRELNFISAGRNGSHDTSAATEPDAGSLVLTGINMRPLLTSIGPLLPDIRAASGMSYTLAALLTALPVIAMGCWRWPLAGSIAISVKSAVLR